MDIVLLYLSHFHQIEAVTHATNFSNDLIFYRKISTLCWSLEQKVIWEIWKEGTRSVNVRINRLSARLAQ